MSLKTFDLESTYAHISGNTASTFAGGQAFWTALMSGSRETQAVASGGWLTRKSHQADSEFGER